MKELKITIEQLRNYLGTGLLVQVGTTPRNLTALQDNCKYALVTAWKGSREKQMVGIENVKPICYRLSDLDKEIEHNGERFVPMGFGCNGLENELKSIFRPMGNATPELVLSRTRFDAVQKLFEWHFWPFGDEYFEQGLVIDKMKHNV